ncbi:hypothetical protein HYU09_04600 [Candidatus Woesearchaeota archaeon]|nr:hypothetical protein [Candidatus Woesearchaeota archaeon]
MALEQISTGIYSMVPYNFRNGQTLSIVVHPFYYIKLDNPHFDRMPYVKNLARFVRRFNGTVITLEAESKLEATANYYKSLGATQNRLFIKTAESFLFFSEIEYEKFIQLVVGFKKPILMAGGYLKQVVESGWGYDVGIETNGCLGYLIEMLEENGIETRTLTKMTFSSV